MLFYKHHNLISSSFYNRMRHRILSVIYAVNRLQRNTLSTQNSWWAVSDAAQSRTQEAVKRQEHETGQTFGQTLQSHFRIRLFRSLKSCYIMTKLKFFTFFIFLNCCHGSYLNNIVEPVQCSIVQLYCTSSFLSTYIVPV